MGILQFDARKTYFDDCGNPITGVRSTQEALKLGGLDYVVEKRPVFFADGTPAKGLFANVRSDTNQVLGAVKKNYTVLQNTEAFDFMDSLVAGGMKFVHAGTTDKGRKTFIVGETEPMKILGDDFAPYILFTNSFDGSTGVQVMFTPVRVFCSNCFTVALKKAVNRFSIRHSKSVKEKLTVARDVLFQNSQYLEYLKSVSEEAAATKMSREQFHQVVEAIVPIKAESSQVIQERQQDFQDDIMRAYDTEDLQNFNGTLYKALMAIADAESHKQPLRITDGAQAAALKRVMGGMVLLNAFIAEAAKRGQSITLHW